MGLTELLDHLWRRGADRADRAARTDRIVENADVVIHEAEEVNERARRMLESLDTAERSMRSSRRG